MSKNHPCVSGGSSVNSEAMAGTRFKRIPHVGEPTADAILGRLVRLISLLPVDEQRALLEVVASHVEHPPTPFSPSEQEEFPRLVS